MEYFPYYITLVIAIVMLIMLAHKIKVAYPVLLVLAGLVISIIPGMPVITISPELVFGIFLPPLLYEAAWVTSWKELWHWRRIIGSFAFVVVFFTALVVAIVAEAFIPGFTLALGFLLGGIVSPPDAVSVAAILKFVKVPKRMTSILEGESLLNDASSLIIMRFAMMAVATGSFVWYSAAASFVWMVAGGVGIGLLIGYLFMKMHKYLPTDANMDIILTLVTPYIMYLAAEHAHSSGVMAVVSGGLYLSNKQHHFLSSSSRVRGVTVWQSIVFVMNGLVFLLIGLALPEITSSLGGVSMVEAIGYGFIITAVLIIVRMISAYGAVIVTLIARNFITVADNRSPGFRIPILMGWSGMRGVVSLAAALSIPVQLSPGVEYPQRNLILFITFVVILTTLLVQGLTLPLLIKKIVLPDYEDHIPEDVADHQIRQGLATHALNHINTVYAEHLESKHEIRRMADMWAGKSVDETDSYLAEDIKAIHLDVIAQQRQWLLKKNQDDVHFDEDVIRKHLHRLDIEEEKMKYL